MSRAKFAADSSLEEAVWSELVSEAKFPARLGIYRVFCSPGPPDWIVGSESRAKFNDLRANSLRIGTGNLFGASRELNRVIRELICLIRESLDLTGDFNVR